MYSSKYALSQSSRACNVINSLRTNWVDHPLVQFVWIVDRIFASVGTTEELYRFGLKFNGVLKKAHRKFSLFHMSEKPMSDRFQHRTMVSKDQIAEFIVTEIFGLIRNNDTSSLLSPTHC